MGVMAIINGLLAYGAFSLGTWLRNKKSGNADTRFNDEALWRLALVELDSDDRRVGLWARAYSKANGNDAAARAIYLRLRVSEMQR